MSATRGVRAEREGRVQQDEPELIGIDLQVDEAPAPRLHLEPLEVVGVGEHLQVDLGGYGLVVSRPVQRDEVVQALEDREELVADVAPVPAGEGRLGALRAYALQHEVRQQVPEDL